MEIIIQIDDDRITLRSENPVLLTSKSELLVASTCYVLLSLPSPGSRLVSIPQKYMEAIHKKALEIAEAIEANVEDNWTDFDGSFFNDFRGGKNE
jgi:hypothetical protein